MPQNSKRKQSRAMQWVKRTVVVGSLVFVLVVVIEEMVLPDLEFRRTLWDRMVGRAEVPQGRAEVSVQLAQEVCRQKVFSELGDSLIHASYDGRSSRYNPEYKVHTIFMNLQISGEDSDDIYARCDVSAVNRRIIEYRIQGWGNPFWG